MNKRAWSAGVACGVMLAVTGAGAQAPSADTVTIGKEKKKTVGRITALNAGDVACYVSLTDDKGAEFEEMAEFEICEKTSLVGKRVSLTYALEKVMADECQGNPDCNKTKTVAIIKKATVIAGKAPAAVPAASSGPRQESFCTPMETVVFSCWSGKKLVSACASKDARPGRGYLQYRFGNPDSPAGMELAFPEGEVAPSKAASGSVIPYSGGGASWLRFPRGEYAYVLYTGIGKWGARGETIDHAGVAVERNGKRVSNLPCSGKYLSELGPDWFERVGITGNPDDFELPEPPVKK